MSHHLKLGLTARIFCVAAVLGLSLALLDRTALQGTLLLAAIAATAIAAEFSARLPDRAILSAEAALAALVIGAALPGGVLMMPYLVIPALIAGIRLGALAVLVTVSIQLLALVGSALASGDLATFTGLSEITGPWIFTTLGVGLVAARLRNRNGEAMDTDAAYESARRLLSQLRPVARRLSSGLDTVAMSNQLLLAVHQQLGDTQSAAFVRTEGGVLAPLAYRGMDARDSLTPEGDDVERCWTEMAPVTGVQAAGRTSRRYRCVLPLRVGFRMIGVVIVELAAEPAGRALSTLMAEVDEHAVRIDTALAFDEIRSIATMEERHRLAREIHDGIAQEIASIGYVVDDLTASATSDAQRRKLHALRDELTRVVSELRLSIFDLRSELSGGLGSALADHVREVGARSGLTVHLTLDVAPTRLRSEVETELLRVTQEAVTNARKHSGAANLWVDCRIRPPYARISIADDGVGLGKPRVDSFGLKIMRERSRRIGADLEISDKEEINGRSGTRVTITVGAEASLNA